MMKDWMAGNWRNNALADMYRPAYEVRNNDAQPDAFGAVGGGLGGFRNQLQQSQFQPQQPQWVGVDQTQWQPQFSQPMSNPYTAQQIAPFQGEPQSQSSYGQAQQMTPNPLAKYARSAYTSNGWGWNG